MFYDGLSKALSNGHELFGACFNHSVCFQNSQACFLPPLTSAASACWPPDESALLINESADDTHWPESPQ